jgi:hypothetical protein
MTTMEPAHYGSMLQALTVGIAGVVGSGALATVLGVLAQTVIVWVGI